MNQATCIFCEIIAARAEGTFIYRDAVCAAFLDIQPVNPGHVLIVDPSGTAIGLPQQWLEGTPFPDYTFPALVLSTVLGLGPLVVAWGLWRRDTWCGTDPSSSAWLSQSGFSWRF